jgi:mRNA interferase RelE/StbE
VPYRIEITTQAAKQLAALEPLTMKRVAARIDALAVEPRPPSARKLATKEGFYRIRVGDYRVIYQVADRRILVTIIRIGHRRDAYR